MLADSLTLSSPFSLSLSCFSFFLFITDGLAGEYGHPQHRAVHDVVVDICEDVGCLSRIWCVHPLRWHKDYEQQSHSHSQLERLSLLDVYDSQRDMMWLRNLETKLVPYHVHRQNRSAMLVGCLHDLPQFRWYCRTWAE